MRTFGASLLLQAAPGKGNPAPVFLHGLEQWFTLRMAAAPVGPRALQRRQSAADRGSKRLHEVEFRQAGDSDGQWVTTVRALENLDEPRVLAVSIEMRIDNIEDRLAPLRVTVRPPGFLRELAGQCTVTTIDGFEAISGPLQIADAEQVELLVGEIFNASRKLPLIVVTDPVYGEEVVKNLPRKLATYLFALGRVYYLPPQMTYTLTRKIGKELSVFDGAVRIYWPGAKDSDSGARHPLYLRATQALFGPNSMAIEKELFARLSQDLIRAAAPRFRLQPSIAEFIQGAELDRIESSNATVQELKAALAERERRLVEALAMEQVALADNQSNLAKLQTIEKDLRSARADLYSEKTKTASLLAALREKGAPAEVTEKIEPSTAEEAVEYGRKQFADTLILPEDIFLETDLGPDVFHVLRAMSEACKAEREGARRDRDLFTDRLSSSLGHPGRYEPGQTGLSCLVDGKRVEVKDRIHLKSTRPVDTESVYFIPTGKKSELRYRIVRIGRHA